MPSLRYGGEGGEPSRVTRQGLKAPIKLQQRQVEGRNCPYALAGMGPRGSQTGQGTGGSTRTKGVPVTPHCPPSPVHPKGVFSPQAQTHQHLPCLSQALGSSRLARQGWGTHGRARDADHPNTDPLPALPQLGSQPCHRWSPKAQGARSWCSRGSGAPGWGVPAAGRCEGQGEQPNPLQRPSRVSSKGQAWGPASPGVWKDWSSHKCSLAIRDRISLTRSTSGSCCRGLLSMALCSLAM